MTVRIDASDGSGSFDAYVAEPAGTPRAAIVVIQEIFGVNPGIRKKCDDWAAKGYLAFAPDLFWRLQPGIELDPDIPEQFQQALGWMNRFDQTKGIEDIEATIKTARAKLGGKGKVGAVGYCLGGRLAFMTATRTDSDASVGYYGVGIDNLLGEKHAIANPVAAPHRRRRSFRHRRCPREDARRARRPSQGDDVRLSRRGSRLRGGDGQAPVGGRSAAGGRADGGVLRGESGLTHLAIPVAAGINEDIRMLSRRR